MLADTPDRYYERKKDKLLTVKKKIIEHENK
jgi:hypothetical protein